VRFLREELKPYIERMLSDMNAANPSVDADPGYTERGDYGEGWELSTKIFEVGSRSAILSAEADTGDITLGAQFNEGKFVHLLLNQWGYSVDREAVFHFNGVAERLAVLYSRGNPSLVERKLPQIMEELQNRFLQQIVDTVRGKMAEP
jgi:hypothetical protein